MTYGVFLVVVTLIYGSYEFFTILARKKHKAILRHLNEYEMTAQRLETWLTARPHLYVGDCDYASSLVQQLLGIIDQLDHLGRSKLTEQRPFLLGLLGEHAPPDDPPPSAGHFH